MSSRKAIGYALGVSAMASLAVLLIGVFLLGFPLAGWTEEHGRWVGLAGTIAGVAGAVVGLRIASRSSGGESFRL